MRNPNKLSNQNCIKLRVNKHAIKILISKNNPEAKCIYNFLLPLTLKNVNSIIYIAIFLKMFLFWFILTKKKQNIRRKKCFLEDVFHFLSNGVLLKHRNCRGNKKTRFLQCKFCKILNLHGAHQSPKMFCFPFSLPNVSRVTTSREKQTLKSCLW